MILKILIEIRKRCLIKQNINKSYIDATKKNLQKITDENVTINFSSHVSIKVHDV